MTLDYLHDSEVHISMVKYIEDVCDTFQEAQVEFDNGFIEVMHRSKYQMTAAPTNLFVVNKEWKLLKEEQQEMFHLCVAKALYFAKQAQPDIHQVYSFLTSQQWNQ